MIFRTAQGFLSEDFGDDPRGAVTADQFMLVRPDCFKVGGCPDNRFAHGEGTVIQTRAKYQHDALIRLLEQTGKKVQVFPGKNPDDVFPNNVFATNKQQQLLVGNMAHEVRQPEMERQDILKWFRGEGFEVKHLNQLTSVPAELTGSLIIDHQKNIGFCGLSQRFHEEALQHVKDFFGLNAIFAFPINIYHTNVGLSILAGKFCVICPDMFERPEDAQAILSFYPQHLVLSGEQMDRFAGNILAVREDVVAVSQTVYFALKDEGRKMLNRHGFQISAVELSELEKSGGSVRCAIMEIFRKK